jgi:phage tail sheath gpL-like
MSEQTGRWAFLQDAYGHVITGKADTFSNASGVTLKNDKHTTYVDAFSDTSTPLSELVASATAVAHYYLTTPPELSKPLRGRVLKNVKMNGSFTFAERNALYAFGHSPLTLDRNGDVIFDRVITTYLTDDLGSADATYKDINIIAQLQYASRYYRNRMQSRFGNTYINNENIELIRSEISNILRELETLDVFENVEDTLKNMIIERNALTPSRIDVKFTPEHVSPLLQTATQIESKI